jgi:hypothetical protein
MSVPSIRRASRRTRLALGAVTGATALLALGASSSNAAIACRPVAGSYVEHAVTGPACLSPVGLCIAATYRGDVKGEATGVATSIIGTADTATTGVSLFTSNSSIEATVAGRRGTLLIKNAGGFGTSGDGPIVDLQTIVGGTGRLAGATGALRAQGTFSFAAGGRSEYEGTVCLS